MWGGGYCTYIYICIYIEYMCEGQSFSQTLDEYERAVADLYYRIRMSKYINTIKITVQQIPPPDPTLHNMQYTVLRNLQSCLKLRPLEPENVIVSRLITQLVLSDCYCPHTVQCTMYMAGEKKDAVKSEQCKESAIKTFRSIQPSAQLLHCPKK